MTEAELAQRLVAEVGPMGTLLGLGFYWLRGQLAKLKDALETIERVGLKVEYTQACVSTIAEVQGVKLPKPEDFIQ